MKSTILVSLALCLSLSISSLSGQSSPPNILLIIADDLGVDRLNGYHTEGLLATTPTLDSLRSTGITFTNVFAAPRCTPTRSAIMSGKYGVKTGVLGTPGNLDLIHQSLFLALEEGTNGAYADALVGKWHLSSPAYAEAPLDHGADFFSGFLGASPEDYYEWQKTEDGETATSTEYVTTAFTNSAMAWIDAQTQPWLMWLAHAAPHAPFHVPPAGTFSVNSPGNNVRRYVAMVESMDYEINRLIQSIDPDVRDNTVIIFVGDNGTPNSVLQDYPSGRGKSTLYQGGARVPMIVSGKGVTRQGERESSLVHVADLHATILEIAGVMLPGGKFNSKSFQHLLGGQASGDERLYNYTELADGDNSGWTIRDERYKLIQFNNGTQELYDLVIDSFELNNLLLAPLSATATASLEDLEIEAEVIRTDWSCRDKIQNGTESDIDCGNDACGSCTTSLTDLEREFPVRIYPNPASDAFWVDAGVQAMEWINIYDFTTGRLLRVIPVNGVERQKINVQANWPRMIYIAIGTERGVRYTTLARL